MALQNRVHPDGSLHATPARGTMMGNRGGRFHRPNRALPVTRRWATRQWICCTLTFKQRQRAVWGDGYTELFFLDEATALAAGHRPCFECRRTDAKRFAACMLEGWGAEAGWTDMPRAPQMDAALQAARVADRHAARERETVRLDAIPIGTFGTVDGAVLAITPGGLMRWSFEGYTKAPEALGGQMALLTPRPIVEALRAGYAPQWHPSVQSSRAATR